MLNMKRNRAGLLAAVLVASVCMPALCLLNAQEAPKDDDVIMRALTDELARSMGRLQLENLQKPYYVGYSVEEGDVYSVAASFGAIISEGGGPGRGLSVSVRVGDYVLDNTNFSGGGWGGGMGGGFGLDDEYDAFRHEIWLRTDSEYKEAIEGLAQKKAYMENQKITERPDDFSTEEPVVLIEPLKKLEVDKKRWSAIVKKLSAIFREYPDIQSSGAMFMAGAQNRYFVNSEGFKQRTGAVMMALAVAANTQCEDGMPLSDYYTCSGRSEKDMPGDDEMLAAVRQMAERLTAMRKAAKAEDYTGPVLFEGQAGAAFFQQVFGNNLGAAREREGGYGFSSGLKLNDKIGKMIAPAFISIVDDSTVQEAQGKPLLGAYAVDEDGVRVGKLSLIENGKLQTLYSTRVPTKEIKKSNGHNRGGMSPGPGNLFVTSTKKLSPADLKARLIEEATDAGLEYGLLVRKLDSSFAQMASVMGGGSMRSMMRYFGGGRGEISISTPIEIVRVYVADGREEPIRGGEISGATLRTLRDVVATGDDTNVCNEQGMGGVISVVAPSVLIKELNLKKPPEKFDKPPLLKNAFFEGK